MVEPRLSPQKRKEGYIGVKDENELIIGKERVKL